MSKFGLVKSLLTFTPINQSPKILNQRIWNIVRYGQGDEIKYSYLNEGEIDPQIYKEIDLYQGNLMKINTAMIISNKLQQYQEREKILEKLAELHEEIGMKHLAKEFSDSAYDDFATIAKLKPELVWQRYDEVRSGLELEKSEIKRRIREIDKVIKLHPNAMWVHYDRAIYRLSLDEDKKALSDLNVEIRNKNINPNAYIYSKFERGRLYKKK